MTATVIAPSVAAERPRDPRIAKILRDVAFVTAHFADLADARIPGTPRRWTQTRTRAESRQHATASAATTELPGVTKGRAPLHLDILDVISDVVATSHALSDAVTQLAGVDRVPPPTSAYADPAPHLKAVTEHLAAAAEADGGWIIDSALDPADDLSIVRARRRTAAALQLILGGQVLDAECPWCSSRPLRIRIAYDEPLVVCESRRVCQPPDEDCGTWLRGRPAWIQAEWEWLANRIRHADDIHALHA